MREQENWNGERAMKPEQENLENLSRAILKEAEADVEQIQAEAKAKADAIRRRTQEQAEAVRKEILDRARQDSERLRSQVVSTAQLSARSAQLAHREKLLNSVFVAAGQKLSSVPQRADYGKIVAQLLREALVNLNAKEAEVRADSATQQLVKDKTADELSKELNAKISVGNPLEEGFGITVSASGGHLNFDNTLETRLNRLQNALRSSVYHVLMGEKL